MPVYTALFPDLVSHFCHTNDSHYFKNANTGLTQSINYPFTFFIAFDLNSVQPV